MGARPWPVAVLIVACWLAVGCGQRIEAGTSSTATPADPGSTTAEPPIGRTLNGILEPENLIVADPGSEWREVERWYTEGANTVWTSDCPGFDRLAGLYNHGLPTTVVWESETAVLVQRVASLGRHAVEFVEAAADLPDTCPTVMVDGVAVELAALDGVPALPSDRTIGVMTGLALDRAPIPDAETDIGNPRFDPDRVAWMVYAVRENVVSQLTLLADPDPEPGPDFPELVKRMVETMASAPVDAVGPFPEPIDGSDPTTPAKGLTTTVIEIEGEGTVVVERQGGCEAEPGSPTDLTAEPVAWLAFGSYLRWTDGAGCPVRIDVISHIRGAAHCGFESAEYLTIGSELGRSIATDDGPSVGNHRFVWDPEGVLPSGPHNRTQSRHDLPADAADTGYRRDGAELWLSSGDEPTLYRIIGSEAQVWHRSPAEGLCG